MKNVALAIVIAVSAVGPTRADVEFEQHGAVATLHSRHLQPGDEEQVQAFLASPQAQGIRIIYMDSRGGNQRAAMAIGEMIRQRGLDTGFDPRRGSRCVSACTAMFLGGVQRFYVGGDRIRDAANTRYGLGFHPGRHPSEEIEDTVNAYYQQMGAPGASSLRYRLYPRDRLDEPFQGVGRRGGRVMWFTGSRTAIRAGVATGVQAPRDERD